MSPQTILIVDPDAASRTYVARVLVERGFNVLQAPSAREGMMTALQMKPAVIIADPVLPDSPGEDFARALHDDESIAGTPLIALSSSPDPARAHACIAAGFREYIRKSSQAISTLMGVLDAVLAPPAAAEEPVAPVVPVSPPSSAAMVEPATRPAAGRTAAPVEAVEAPAPVVPPASPLPAPAAEAPQASPRRIERKGGLLFTFLSAKGGTGTSSLCANLAMNISANVPEARVVVVDMVLPIGSIAHIVGYEGSQDIIAVADQPPTQVSPDYFKENLEELDVWRFHLLAGSPDPERSHMLNIGRVLPIVNALRGAYDFVLLDIGRALSKITMPLIEEADLIALIVGTDTSTVTLTKTLVNYLKDQGVNPQRIYSILNRAVGLEGLTKAEAEKVIGISINTAMPHMSGQVALANNQHQPLSVKYPKDTIAIILKETALEMATLARRLRGH